MFSEVFRFELRQQLRSRWTWVCMLLLALFLYRDVAGAYWDQLTGSGRVVRNSAYSTYYILLFATFWTNILAAVFFPAPFLRDVKSRMASMVYATQVSPPGYFWGKYLASLCTLLMVSTGSVWGFASVPFFAHHSHMLHGAYGPVLWVHLWHAWLLIIVPAVLLHGSVHSLLVLRTGKLAASYVYCIAHTMLWVLVMIAYPDTAAPATVQVLDPIGKTTLEGQLFYWSAEQRVHNYLQLLGPLLWNRLLTLLCSAIALIAAARSFSFARLLGFMRTREKSRVPGQSFSAASRPLALPTSGMTVSVVARSFTAWTWFRTALHLAWREFSTTIRQPALRIVLLIGTVLCWMSSSHLGGYAPLERGALLPTFGEAFPLAASVFFIAILIAMLYYTGEVFSREQNERMGSLVGATSVPDVTLIFGKAAAMVLLSIALSLVPVVGYLATQGMQGFWHPGWSMVVSRETLDMLVPMIGFGALAAVIHCLLSSRIAAHAVAMLLAISIVAMSEIHVLENPLLLPFMPIEGTLVSAFHVHRQEYQRLIEFDLYWLALVVFLLVVAWVVMRRGNERAWRQRNIVTRSMGVASIVIAAMLVAGTALTVERSLAAGGELTSRDAQNQQAATYEKTYGHLRGEAQPRTVHGEFAVDIFNSQRAAHLAAQLMVRNDSRQAIDHLDFEVAEHARLGEVRWNGEVLKPEAADTELRVYTYKLGTALAPGATAKLGVSEQVQYTGFAASGFTGYIATSAALIAPELWPRLGYNRGRELELAGDRRRWGLPARVAERDKDVFLDSSGVDRYIWQLQVSADPGQVVAASGQPSEPVLQTQTGRPVYRFSTDVASPWKLSIATGTYATATAVWDAPSADGSPVLIQVHYLPQNGYNVARYLQAAQFAVAGLTRRFGAFPYRTLTIAEVPEPFLDATTTAGNLVLVPELHGWTHDYRRPVAFDWIQSQVAEATAKAWWGQKVAPSTAPGGRLLSEGVPAFLALEILRDKQGEGQTQLRRTNLETRYLRESATEELIEPSLSQWDDEVYLESKAPFTLYAMRERLGDAWLDAALQGFLKAHDSGRPVDAASLLDDLVRATPPAVLDAVNDDLRAVSVYDASLEREPHTDSSGRVTFRRFGPVGLDNRGELPPGRPMLVVGQHEAQTLIDSWVRPGTDGLNLPRLPAPAEVTADPHNDFIDVNRGNNRLHVR